MRETLFVRSSFLNFVSISVIIIGNQTTVEIPNVTKASTQPGMRRQFLLRDYIHAYTYTCTYIYIYIYIYIQLDWKVGRWVVIV